MEAIAIELDFMKPAVTGRRLVDAGGELRFYEPRRRFRVFF